MGTEASEGHVKPPQRRPETLKMRVPGQVGDHDRPIFGNHPVEDRSLPRQLAHRLAPAGLNPHTALIRKPQQYRVGLEILGSQPRDGVKPDSGGVSRMPVATSSLSRACSCRCPGLPVSNASACCISTPGPVSPAERRISAQAQPTRLLRTPEGRAARRPFPIPSSSYRKGIPRPSGYRGKSPVEPRYSARSYLPCAWPVSVQRKVSSSAWS